MPGASEANFTSSAIELKKFCILEGGRSNFLSATSGKMESIHIYAFVFAKALGWRGPWREKKEGNICITFIFSKVQLQAKWKNVSPPLLSMFISASSPGNCHLNSS